ncbi:MAG: hypothetical protein E6Q97_28275 [Desulfurellales bacterium]|nr:MAG: hypothetical protein E6Q97_28275 [Desulfurellales bacterium]
MRLFAIQVPGTANKHNRIAGKQFRDFLLQEIGGFNAREVSGAWRDEKTGKDHIEPMVEYQVACDPALMFDIQQKAMKLWPDEICFYVAELGFASIVYPPQKTMVTA